MNVDSRIGKRNMLYWAQFYTNWKVTDNELKKYRSLSWYAVKKPSFKNQIALHLKTSHHHLKLFKTIWTRKLQIIEDRCQVDQNFTLDNIRATIAKFFHMRKFSTHHETVLLEGCGIALSPVVEVSSPHIVTQGVSFDLLRKDNEYA